MAEIEIREAEHGDWEGIARLLADPPPVPGSQLRRQVAAENDPLLAYVAVAPGDGADTPEVVGALVGGVPRRSAGAPDGAGEVRSARLTWVGVQIKRRRHGIGRKLLHALLEELRRRQVRRLTLSVEGTEVEALGLFRSEGFEKDGDELDLLLPLSGVMRLASDSGRSAEVSGDAVVRQLRLDDVPLLTGLLIQLAVERAVEPHDGLRALTPAEVESALQRPGTSGAAAWERDDPSTPVGIAWVTRRRQHAVLHFIGVHDEMRRRGIGTALLREALPSADVPLRTRLSDPGEVEEFFRRLGFEAERVVSRFSRSV